MSEIKHTPTPWAYEAVGDIPGRDPKASDRPTVCYVGDYRIVRDEASRYDDHADDKDDAAFIVTACNCHADLQAENERLREALAKSADQLKRVYDDAFRQCAGYGLVTSDGRAFSCMELNKCALAGGAAARAVLNAGGDNG